MELSYAGIEVPPTPITPLTPKKRNVFARELHDGIVNYALNDTQAQELLNKAFEKHNEKVQRHIDRGYKKVTLEKPEEYLNLIFAQELFACDQDGNTLLHKACSLGYTASKEGFWTLPADSKKGSEYATTVAILLIAGADVSLRNTLEQTPRNSVIALNAFLESRKKELSNFWNHTKQPEINRLEKELETLKKIYNLLVRPTGLR